MHDSTSRLAGFPVARPGYTPYGYQDGLRRMAGGPGFNGEFHEPALGWQLLGNGYRAYNPVLMRFHSPDSRSPFAEGGINAYAYCMGDPVNATDPTGHWGLSNLLRSVTGRQPKVQERVVKLSDRELAVPLSDLNFAKRKQKAIIKKQESIVKAHAKQARNQYKQADKLSAADPEKAQLLKDSAGLSIYHRVQAAEKLEASRARLALVKGLSSGKQFQVPETQEQWFLNEFRKNAPMDVRQPAGSNTPSFSGREQV